MHGNFRTKEVLFVTRQPSGVDVVFQIIAPAHYGNELARIIHAVA